MTGLSRRQWALPSGITRILTDQVGLTAADLAKRLHVAEAELKPVVGMMLGRGQLVRCGNYLTLPPEPERAA